MAVTRKEQIASGKKVTPLTREELRLAGKTFAPLNEDERFQKVAYGGGTSSKNVQIIDDQTVGTSKSGGIYVGEVSAYPFDDEVIDVTFDSVKYPGVVALEIDGTYYYGEMSQQGAVFTKYPFLIVCEGKVMLAAQSSGNHTLSATASRKSVVPEGAVEITSNSVVDVSGYAIADVSVPASAVVSGTKNISSNGEHDVTEYQIAKVNVPSFQYGELAITNNLGIKVVVSNLDTNGVYGTAEGQSVSIPDGQTKTVRMTVGKTSPNATKYTLIGPVTIYSSGGIPDFVVNQPSAFPKAYSGNGVLKDGKTTTTTALININGAFDSQGRDTTSGGIVLALANQQ